ncbi:hypothetical protein P4O66_008686, partial [Electrophorus voltai]
GRLEAPAVARPIRCLLTPPHDGHGCAVPPLVSAVLALLRPNTCAGSRGVVGTGQQPMMGAPIPLAHRQGLCDGTPGEMTSPRNRPVLQHRLEVTARSLPHITLVTAQPSSKHRAGVPPCSPGLRSASSSGEAAMDLSSVQWRLFGWDGRSDRTDGRIYARGTQRKRGNVWREGELALDGEQRTNKPEMIIRQLLRGVFLPPVEFGSRSAVLRALSGMPHPKSDMTEFREVFSKAKHVAIITGAGVSAESGLPTFRAASGHWRKWKTQDLATAQAFSRNPSRVWEFYHYWRELAIRAEPSAAHRAIAECEARLSKQGRSVVIITQNTDELHRRAGSRHVLEIHGNLFRTRCLNCGDVETNHQSPICTALKGKGFVSSSRRSDPDPSCSDANIPVEDLPRCNQGGCDGLLRPDVIWFGETLDSHVLTKVEKVLDACDLCLLGFVVQIAGWDGVCGVPCRPVRPAGGCPGGPSGRIQHPSKSRHIIFHVSLPGSMCHNTPQRSRTTRDRGDLMPSFAFPKTAGRGCWTVIWPSVADSWQGMRFLFLRDCLSRGCRQLRHEPYVSLSLNGMKEKRQMAWGDGCGEAALEHQDWILDLPSPSEQQPTS